MHDEKTQKPVEKLESCLWKNNLEEDYVSTECSKKVDFSYQREDTECEMPSNYVDPADFIFCPYCGKTITKIK